MKKTILTLLAIFVTLNLFATNVATIRGSWNRSYAHTGLKISKIERGALVTIATYMPESDKRFYFAFAPATEGFYAIHDGPSAMNCYTFYFKPGDQLNVDIQRVGYKLVGENTPENLEISAWSEFVQPLEDMAIYFMTTQSTYVDFFPLFEQKLEEFRTFKAPATKNEVFNRAFAAKRILDLNQYALNLAYTPRSAHPQDEDFPDFYRNITVKGLTSSDAILDYPFGVSLIERASMMERQFKPQPAAASPSATIESIVAESQNQIITGEILLNNIKRIRTFPGFEEFMQKYGANLVTDHQIATAKAIGLDLRSKQVDDVKAINFKAQDTDGKQVQFSDYLGKVIYIDVWATWCGPCRAEIPSLKKLTAEYAGKDIIFLSVSTDKVADLEKWRTMVREEELQGVQLFAGEASAYLLKGYGIAGIPRFILIDKDGKVLQNDAPRPTSSEIRPLLNSVLK